MREMKSLMYSIFYPFFSGLLSIGVFLGENFIQILSAIAVLITSAFGAYNYYHKAQESKIGAELERYKLEKLKEKDQQTEI